jgi:uncharacterized protein (DUF305 family)
MRRITPQAYGPTPRSHRRTGPYTAAMSTRSPAEPSDRAATEATATDATDATTTGAAAPESVSDEATQRILRGVVIGLLVAVVIAAFAGAALWAASGDDEDTAPMSATDVGFLQDMLDHHDQALLISELYLDGNPDGDAAPYAREVIMFQEREIGWMEDWLAEEGYERGEPDRIAMEWMGEPTPVAEMTGMQTQEALDALAAARGAQADRLFFLMMSSHHLGGVHMADHQAANGTREDIVEFAEAVSRNQRIEVAEYRQAMERLGLGQLGGD